MNVVRRKAALLRNIEYTENEVQRIRRLKEGGDPGVVALWHLCESHLADLDNKIVKYKQELAALETDCEDDSPE